MPRYKRIVEQENGKSEWIKPVKRGYKMACCDCGLVHRLDFETVKFGKGRKIIFRAWRDVRATAAMRRGREFKNK